MWNGSIWTPLITGLSTPGQVNAIAIYDTKIYIGGLFVSQNGGIILNNIGVWNNNNLTWTQLIDSSGNVGLNNAVNTIAINSLGNIYLGGLFTSQEGGIANVLNYVAKWSSF